MYSYHRGNSNEDKLIEAMAGQKISFFFLMSIIETYSIKSMEKLHYQCYLIDNNNFITKYRPHVIHKARRGILTS